MLSHNINLLLLYVGMTQWHNMVAHNTINPQFKTTNVELCWRKLHYYLIFSVCTLQGQLCGNKLLNPLQKWLFSFSLQACFSSVHAEADLTYMFIYEGRTVSAGFSLHLRLESFKFYLWFPESQDQSIPLPQLCCKLVL